MPTGGGGMMVYLGVPELKADQANLRSAKHAAEAAYNPRYTPAEIEELDANTGEHARKILVQRLRCRLFFGDEDRAGYDCLAAARVMPAPGGAGAVLDPNYLPPALTMGAWEPLPALGQDISSRVQATLGALRQAAGSEEIGDILGSSRGLEFGFKHLALAGSAQVIGQMAQTPAMQPHAVYLELARLLGALTIFAGEARLQSAPPYDHNDLGGCFGRIKQALEALLERLASPSYLRRSFKLRKDRLEVDLEPDWVSGRRRLFVGVSGSDDPETMAGKAAGLKICAPRDREEILHRRLGAIPIEWLRTAPPPLPGRGKTLYGRIAAGGPFWAGVQEDLALVLMGSESLPYSYDLYIV
jgi:type VI secretion system protein ImpJ